MEDLHVVIVSGRKRYFLRGMPQLYEDMNLRGCSDFNLVLCELFKVIQRTPCVVVRQNLGHIFERSKIGIVIKHIRENLRVPTVSRDL
jgi:hypothetical protein